MRQHSNYLRFKTSIDYHLKITKRGNCVDLFIYFLGVEGIISKHFFFYMLNFPKRYVLDLR